MIPDPIIKEPDKICRNETIEPPSKLSLTRRGASLEFRVKKRGSVFQIFLALFLATAASGALEFLYSSADHSALSTECVGHTEISASTHDSTDSQSIPHHDCGTCHLGHCGFLIPAKVSMPLSDSPEIGSFEVASVLPSVLLPDPTKPPNA